MMRRLLMFLSFCTLLSTANSQDIHFSQYYASPLTLNPALTGLHGGDFRAVVNYRSQWFAIPTFSSWAPYTTVQASFDARLFPERMRENILGMGLAFYNDAAGNGNLTTRAGLFSLSYHQGLDRFGRSNLGLGLQTGYVSKRVNEGDLIFEQQWDAGANAFNPLAFNGESFQNGNISYPEVNAGALFSSQPNEKFGYLFGVGVNHVHQPNESFLGEDNKLNTRINAHAAAQIKVGDYSYITPTVLYMLQGNAQQANVGSGFEYELADNVSAFAGGWARLVGGINGFGIDAIIGVIGVDAYNMRAGLSYDVTLSDLRVPTNSNGALELSLIYTHNKQGPMAIDYNRFCPKF